MANLWSVQWIFRLLTRDFLPNSIPKVDFPKRNENKQLMEWMYIWKTSLCNKDVPVIVRSLDFPHIWGSYIKQWIFYPGNHLAFVQWGHWFFFSYPPQICYTYTYFHVNYIGNDGNYTGKNNSRLLIHFWVWKSTTHLYVLL